MSNLSQIPPLRLPLHETGGSLRVGMTSGANIAFVIPREPSDIIRGERGICTLSQMGNLLQIPPLRLPLHETGGSLRVGMTSGPNIAFVIPREPSDIIRGERGICSLSQMSNLLQIPPLRLPLHETGGSLRVGMTSGANLAFVIPREPSDIIRGERGICTLPQMGNLLQIPPLRLPLHETGGSLRVGMTSAAYLAFVIPREPPDIIRGERGICTLSQMSNLLQIPPLRLPLHETGGSLRVGMTSAAYLAFVIPREPLDITAYPEFPAEASVFFDSPLYSCRSR